MVRPLEVWFISALSALALIGCGGQSSNNSGAASGAGTGGSQAGASGNSSGGAAEGGFTEGGAAPADAGDSNTGGLIEVPSKGGVPSDSRPEAPAWQPDFPLGEPGWKSSKTPLCPTSAGRLTALGVWADQRGVFALTSHACSRDRESFIEDCKQSGLALELNEGKGWSVVFSTGEDVSGNDIASAQLSGFPGGALLDFGALRGKWGLFSIAEGVAKEQPFSGRVYVVDATTAYGVSDTHVYKFDGSSWGIFAELPAAVAAVWADDSRVIVAGSDDAVYQSAAREADFSALPNAPLGTHSVVWGFAERDLWLSSDNQLSHFDGASWDIVDTADLFGQGALTEAWGTSDVLYVRSQRALARITHGQAESLIPESATAGGLSLSGLFGRSNTEVFVSLENERDYGAYQCSGDFMLWFDGTTFHRF